MTRRNCLTEQQMLDYSSGALPADDAEQVAAHLESCAECSLAVERLDTATDWLIEALKRPLSDEDRQFTGEAAFTAAVDAVSALPVHPGVIEHAAARTAADSAPLPVQVGAQIRDYEILDVLGRGGMGVVFRARHMRLGRIVAIKLLSPAELTIPQMVERFNREMQAVGRVDHPNIVRAYDAGQADGLHYLAMELVDGCDLAALLRHLGPLASADACELIRQAAVGLQHAYENSLVHRDLKPANLMLTRDGQVKILDLGLARLQTTPPEHHSGLTLTGQLMGTLDYMSPEQADNTRDVDVRADIYSLGATLFALLTGRAPFAGPQYDSMMKKVVALSTEAASRVDALRSEIPPELTEIVARALHRDPEQRFQIPRELASALVPFCAGHNCADLVSILAATPQEVRPAPMEFSTASAAHVSAQTVIDTAAPAHSRAESPAAASDGVSKIGACAAENADSTSTSARQRRRMRVCFLTVCAGVSGLLAILFGGQLLRIATDRGLLLIDADASALEVTILRGDETRPIVIRDRATDRKYTLDSGDDYRIVVTELSTGHVFRTDRLAIERGGRKVLEVQFAPLPAETTADPQIPDQRTQVADNAGEPVSPLTAEPPTLDDWLTDREIITVAKDGSGDYDAIREAFEHIRDGQVVEVTDTGPYDEALPINLAGPSETGLITRRSTVLRLSPQSDQPLRVHGAGSVSFRLSGFVIVSPEGSRRDSADFLLLDWCDGVVLENCVFISEGPPAPAPRVSMYGESGTGRPICVRENIGHVCIRIAAESAGPVIVARNVLVSGSPLPESISIGKSAKSFRSVVITHNVLHGSTGVHILMQQFAETDIPVRITNNTFTILGTRAGFDQGIPGPDVVIADNLFGWNLWFGAPDFAVRTAAFNGWTRTNNLYLFGQDNVGAPMSDGETELPANGTSVFLSTDLTDRNFARLRNDLVAGPADGPASVSLMAAGAVPPGPAPAEGDWLTRLLERLE
ncbi:MAG: protein kinase [Planctomycetaceae bacterium]